jgi:hypothetical protein
MHRRAGAKMHQGRSQVGATPNADRHSEKIAGIERRLEWEAPGPLTGLSNQMTGSLFSLLRALA